MSTVVDRLTSTDLRFDVVGHQYFVGNVRVPGVTEILKAVGVSRDFDALRDRSSRLADAIEVKREIGHALHADAHAFDDDDLVWHSVHPDVEPYLRAWQEFRANTDLVPLARERRVFHPQLWFAGTLDGVFVRASARRVLVDIKTGDPDDSGCQYQTAAYAAAWLLEHPDQVIHERWGVQLLPGRQVPYEIHTYTDWRDWQLFQTFNTTYQHQAASRDRSQR